MGPIWFRRTPRLTLGPVEKEQFSGFGFGLIFYGGFSL